MIPERQKQETLEDLLLEARILLKYGLVEDAEKSLILACQRESKAVEPHFLLLELYEWLEDQSNKASELEIIGSVLVQQGRRAEALDYYKRLIDLMPEHEEAKRAISELESVKDSGVQQIVPKPVLVEIQPDESNSQLDPFEPVDHEQGPELAEPEIVEEVTDPEMITPVFDDSDTGPLMAEPVADEEDTDPDPKEPLFEEQDTDANGREPEFEEPFTGVDDVEPEFDEQDLGLEDMEPVFIDSGVSEAEFDIFEPEIPDSDSGAINFGTNGKVVLKDLFEDIIDSGGTDSRDENRDLLAKGREKMEQGEITGAISLFQKAVRDPVCEAEACLLLGLCFIKENHGKLAERFFNKGLNLPGQSEEYYKEMCYNLAVIYEMMNRIPEAISALEQIAGIDPEYQDVLARIELLSETLD